MEIEISRLGCRGVCTGKKMYGGKSETAEVVSVDKWKGKCVS